MIAWNRVWHLSRTLLQVELEARDRWLVLYPVGFGLLFVAVVALTATVPGVLTGTSQSTLEASLEFYFADVTGPTLAIALVVVQAPLLLSVFSAIVAVPTARSLAGRRAVNGEFENLLATPFAHAEVFAALVVTSFLLAIGQTLLLGIIGVTGGWLVLWVTGASFTLLQGPVVYAPFLIPFSVALWAALVTTVVFLVYPESALSGTGIGNALLLVAFLPAFGLLGLITAAPGLSPILVAVGGFLGVGLLSAVGATAVGRWFEPVRVL